MEETIAQQRYRERKDTFFLFTISAYFASLR